MSGVGTKRKPTKNAKGPAQKRRKPKGMPDFKSGETLIDLVKKQWRLGDLIGWGGFGALYYASPNIDKNVDDKATFVAKVEPHSNGPLFGELAFYQRVAKEDSLKAWVSSKKLKHLGVPQYIGSGSHEKGGKKYRFMIMERYGDDVDQIFAECSKCFDIHTVLTLAIKIINILEYIHNHGYVHADIKGSNLMMGYGNANKNQVFLVDYGLAYRFSPDGVHKEYKEDPKRRHDGTIEFTSRDAHKGVAPSRRTDLEILGYVMLQWLGGKLPWEDKLADKQYVMDSKIKYMDKIPQLLEECLKGQKSGELADYLQYVVELEYNEEPDYNKLRKIFQDGLRKRRFTDDGKGVTFKSGQEDEVELNNGHSEEDKEDEENGKQSSDEELSDKSPSPIKRRKRNPKGKKVETTAPPVESSPVKQKPARKTTTKPAALQKDVAKQTTTVGSPSKAKQTKTKQPTKVTSPKAKPTTKVTSPSKAKPTTKVTSPSKAKPTTKVESPPKTKPTTKVASPPKAKSSRKRPISSNEEKPVKKTRGRPRKPVLVDTATSP